MGAGHLDSKPEDAKDGAPKGASPYSTGGGGVTFERKVAVTYLARLLTGDGATELGDGRRVVSVAFQQAPDHPVDDLVVTAARDGEDVPSLVLAVGVRRAPDLVNSDESTRKLFIDFVRGAVNASAKRPEHGFALVVAGPYEPARQLATLADLAAVQTDAAAFVALVRAPKKFAAPVRGRLNQLEGLVKHALVSIGVPDPGTTTVQQRTWELLSRLTVVMPRLEPPDETDWAAVVNSLVPVAGGGDLAGASRLRDRLVALADDYPPKAATIDLTILRRAAHTALDSSARRHQCGWRALRHLDARAFSSVHDHIAADDEPRRLRIDRHDLAASVFESATTGTAVIVHGESGVGKSSLVLHAARSAADGAPDATQAICINLRHLPRTTLEFESELACPLDELLSELSAPKRMLVIDGADAVAEGMSDQLRYLVDAAHNANVTVVAIAASDNSQDVRDIIAERFGRGIVEHIVPGLTDTQVDEVVATFTELANLARNTRSRELLRRPVVVDLLVRGGISGTPLSDADAMQQVWAGLVRRRERSERGTPDARDFAMLRLADLALSGGDPLDVMSAIDPTALEGLRSDGLLRRPVDDPFRVGPEFAHDEVRRYAVARLMLAGSDLTTKLLKAGVPRWALGASRLAVQARLAAPETGHNPLPGRFAHLQAAFDTLVERGHGERWGDVPSEALVTLGDPEPVLRDTWRELRAGKATGFQRLARLIDQQLRDEHRFVRIDAVEPIVTLLLADTTPWRSVDGAANILRDWLHAHLIAGTASGHRLRVRLRDRLVEVCAAADRRLAEKRAAQAAAKAARSPEEIEAQRRFVEEHPGMFTEIGYPRSSNRERPEVPSEITNGVVLELLALLGPDLGEEGEAILRRVGTDAPDRLAPAVEEVLTGPALAMYRSELLAALTTDYYINDDEQWPGFEDGIRDHASRGIGMMPCVAWYRGPFFALLRADFRNGVGVLNRILNHAALSRARTLAESDRRFGSRVGDGSFDGYRATLAIAGTRRNYIGDDQAWLWYRGMGVGPYPCMSALQALEVVSDEHIAAGASIPRLVDTLLDGCENLAMVGLITGLLIRHLDGDERLVDLYLAEPIIWKCEFFRMVRESGGLAVKSSGIAGAERRKWSMREAAAFLVIRVDVERTVELRAVGQRLVENGRRLIDEAFYDSATDERAGNAAAEEQLAIYRAWASALDRDTYEAYRKDDRSFVQSTPPADVVQTLQRGNEDVRRAQEASRLMFRYVIAPNKGTDQDVPANELVVDLAFVRDLLDNPPAMSIGDRWSAPAAVAAAALSARLMSGVVLPDDLVAFAADTVLRVAESTASSRDFDVDDSYFEQGADRIAARALPMLLLPSAVTVLTDLGGDVSSSRKRVINAATTLARAAAHEVRLHFARGLDRVWLAPCTAGDTCHHHIALQLALETLRDCVLGEWDRGSGRRRALPLEDPVDASLAKVPEQAIYVVRLDAAIRALAPAAAAHDCVFARARAALDAVVAAQRSALLAHDKNIDPRGSHALVTARALLTLAATGDSAPIFDQIEALAERATLLGSFLFALSSAAEESATRATAARRLWPEIAARVLQLHASGHASGQRSHGGISLDALLPSVADDIAYPYREVEGSPIVWWDPLAWRDIVERWLPFARDASSVDHLIRFLGALPREEQIRSGLPWISVLVLAMPDVVAKRSNLLPRWLIDTRPVASDLGMLADWQRVVDALVVAGVGSLAPYSD